MNFNDHKKGRLLFPDGSVQNLPSELDFCDREIISSGDYGTPKDLKPSFVRELSFDRFKVGKSHLAHQISPNHETLMGSQKSYNDRKKS